MNVIKFSVWVIGSPYVALTMATIWSLVVSDPLESSVSNVDLADVYEFSDDPDQIIKTWDQGYVYVPGASIGDFIFGKIDSKTVQDRLADIPQHVHYPTVIYLHDAGGISAKVHRLQYALEGENIAMVLPNSFARDGRKSDCTGGVGQPENCEMSPEVYLQRRSELIYAVKATRRLPWVDQNNIFLMGLGEGGAAVALWGSQVNVSGYVIIDWTCTAPEESPWFKGLRTPSDRPTLVLMTSENRWTAKLGWDGSCIEENQVTTDRELLVLYTGIRNIFGWQEGKYKIIEFLYLNMNAQAH